MCKDVDETLGANALRKPLAIYLSEEKLLSYQSRLGSGVCVIVDTAAVLYSADSSADLGICL